MSDDYPYIIPIVEAFDRLPYQIGPFVERQLEQQFICPLPTQAIKSVELIHSVTDQHFSAENYLWRAIRQICFQGFVGSLPPRKK
ncbi:MAG: hypothetical protein EGR44_00100 [Ruminococcaceae bacterium]|nr:hypothetical protein [Oscillospiraceae bacterium]MBD9070047.1 hypothetical protein [Oscillospiraceae bacterium]